MGRIGVKGSQQLVKNGTDPFYEGRVRGRKWFPSQGEQMHAFILIQAQDAHEVFQHIDRDRNISSLLEPGIPGDADADELCHFFASQSWRSSPHPRR